MRVEMYAPVIRTHGWEEQDMKGPWFILHKGQTRCKYLHMLSVSLFSMCRRILAAVNLLVAGNSNIDCDRWEQHTAQAATVPIGNREDEAHTS